MNTRRTCIGLAVLFGVPIILGLGGWSLYRNYGLARLEKGIENPAAAKLVFREGDQPRVHILDLRVAPGTRKDADQVVLIATARYEGPKPEPVDLTSLAFAIEDLCVEAIEATVVKVEDPPNAIVCRGLVREGIVVDPFDPFRVAIAFGRRSVTPKAAEEAFAGVRLLKGITPECRVAVGGTRTAYVELSIRSDLRVLPWDGLKPAVERYLSVIPLDGSDAYEPPTIR